MSATVFGWSAGDLALFGILDNCRSLRCHNGVLVTINVKDALYKNARMQTRFAVPLHVYMWMISKAKCYPAQKLDRSSHNSQVCIFPQIPLDSRHFVTKMCCQGNNFSLVCRMSAFHTMAHIFVSVSNLLLLPILSFESQDFARPDLTSSSPDYRDANSPRPNIEWSSASRLLFNSVCHG